MDYVDKHSVTIRCRRPITSQEMFEMIFSNYPPSVKFLFGLRNRLATLFGLKSSEDFHNYISEQTSSYTRINKDDKHLSVSVMLECGDWTEGCQLVSLATFVKFHNQMGKIYFLLIKRVHGLLCRMALNRVVKAVKTTEEKINGSNENS